MTPSEIDKLERIVKAATPAPWRDEREPFPVRNPWFERHDGAPIESRGTPFGLGVAVGVTAEPRDAAAIAALHNAAPALIDAARDLLWHEERNGTRAEQEAEDAELDAERARVDALSDEECIAELATEGIDYDASRKKFDVMLKVCAERADLERKLDDVTRRAAGYEMECAEIDQVLGRALGYPSNPDDADGVCTGEHTPASLAVEAAREVERLRAFVPRWRMKRYSPTAVMWRLFVGNTAIPDTGLHPTDAGRVFASGDGKGYPNIDTAARAVCARLGIPYVPVEVSDG